MTTTATTTTGVMDVLKETFSRFGADNASIYAAAIAYAGVFSIAPLIIIAIAIAGAVLGVASGGHAHHVVENQLIAALAKNAGRGSADAVRSIVDSSFSSHQGSLLAQTIGWATFALAASGLFLTIQSALNVIWHAKPTESGIWLTVRNRAASALMLLAIGIVVLAAVALNIGLGIVLSRFSHLLPFPGAGAIAWIVSEIVEAAVIAVLFGLIYKVLPDTNVGWEDVKIGALASAVLFVVGEALLGIYISHAGIANGYGAAGSIVVLLVWAYYSAMLFLIGAEFSHVYAERHGSLARPPASPANG